MSLDSVSGNSDGKNWQGLDKTASDQDYQNNLMKKLIQY